MNNIRGVDDAPVRVERATMDDVNPFRRRGAGVDDQARGVASAADQALAAAAYGDATAFSTFYDAVSPVVYGTVLRVIRNPALAEEVAQEVFVELWRQATRYDRSKGSAAAWAATVA
ncbi:MAG TPA: sigma factor, partial [Ilumatobacter sp.]|nr:sigma factor [Ilumatobacter sp.]